MVKKGLSVSEGNNGLAGSKGSSVKGILFFLFALAVCFGYFYFFTDVLRTQEETPGQPDVYTSEVRKPLPERAVQFPVSSAEETLSSPPVVPLPGRAGADSIDSAEGLAAGRKSVQPVPVAKKQPVAPLKTLPANKAATGKTAQPAKIAALKKTERANPVPDTSPARKNSAALKSTEREKTSTADPAKAGLRPPPSAGGVSKKTAAGQKNAAGKTAKTPASVVTPKKREIGGQAGTKAVGERYALIVGTYVLKSSLNADKAKLQKAGLQTSVVPGKVRSEPMNRLLVAEVSSAQAALVELAKVKAASKDAFYLKENNKYAIYAGSYFAQGRADQEQERLRKRGFAPILKKSQAPVTTYALSVGSYPTRAAALQGAENLKKLGFDPYPVAVKK